MHGLMGMHGSDGGRRGTGARGPRREPGRRAGPQTVVGVGRDRPLPARGHDGQHDPQCRPADDRARASAPAGRSFSGWSTPTSSSLPACC